MTERQDIIPTFLEESHDGLDVLELDLVALEARPDDAERLTRIYRIVHTLKGTCSLLQLSGLESLAHRAEDVLDALREGRLAFTAPVATLLLRLADEVRHQLRAIEATQQEAPAADAGLIDGLAALVEAPGAAPAPFVPAAAAPAGARHETSIRVDAAVLDTLMDLAGELMLVRGRLSELAPATSAGLVDAHRQLRRTSGELLETIRQARLQPVGTVLRKLPRIVRDVAADLDKPATVALSGEEVGVDRAVNEALADALLHIARNAVDHGLEHPADRVAAGKPAVGTVRVDATQEGGRVRLVVGDDGIGIDTVRLTERAVAAGAVTREVADALSEADRLDLLFRPGVTTREHATAVSGRGVGMDAVRAALGRVGGTVEVASRPGRGTTFTIDVPLTLAIVACVVVEAAGQRFCLPQAGVREVVRLDTDALALIGGARTFRRRGELVPVVGLGEAFAIAPPPASVERATAVVVEGRHRRVALVVDTIGDALEAVVKPLPRSVRDPSSLRSHGVFSGVTIMSDGQPSLIVDLDALAGHLGLRTAEPAPEPVADGPAPAETVPLLLARGRGGRQLGVPTAGVSRLERVGRGRLRESAGLTMLEYRDGLLPLVRLDAPGATADLEVIVCAGADGELGIVVEAIDDIVRAELVMAAGDGRPGVARLVDRDGVAELLDPRALR